METTTEEKGYKRPSMRKSVNTKCRQCTYDKMDKGSAAQQIAVCLDFECGLHGVRPMTASVIPVRLLDHWGIKKEQLCERAQPLVREVEVEEETEEESTDED
jgi:hypothetical protein